MDRSIKNGQLEDGGGDKPPSRRVKLTENERVAKSRIIARIFESTDTDRERNTLTRLFMNLKEYIPRSTLFKYLKQLVDQKWLVEDSDEIRANNNQPMKIVRYVINPKRAGMVQQMVADRRSKDEAMSVL